MRTCNTVENIHIHKVISLWDRVIFHPRDRGNYKESAPCPITKPCNSSHFHIPLTFVPYFPSHAVSDIFSIPFLILEI